MRNWLTTVLAGSVAIVLATAALPAESTQIERVDKSLKYAKLVMEPFATDYGYFAAAAAMTGDIVAAKAAAAEVTRLTPDWSVEKYLSDSGGYPENLAILFIEGARKAGVAACVPASKLSSNPNLVRLKACDADRAHQAAG